MHQVDELLGWQRSAQMVLREVSSPTLREDRMREILESFLSDTRSEDTAGDWLLKLVLSRKVVERLDCPEELLLMVVMHPNRQIAKHLIESIHARPDCPEEVRIAAFLARD